MNRGSNAWERVSKRRPCPICTKNDWCLYAGPPDSPTAAICSRIESDRRAGDAGWLHRLRDETDRRRPTRQSARVVPIAKPEERPILDFGAFARQCHVAALPLALAQLAGSLGLSVESLRRLLVGWSPKHGAWTFAMSNAAGHVTGIRLRFRDGRKLSVRGGKEGLFVPADLGGAQQILIAEGPTDTAALLDLGFVAVGRPSCTGGVKLLVDLVRKQQPREVVVVADQDAPGQRGAETLASAILTYLPGVKIVMPPDGIKDARAWRRAGATGVDVEAVIAAAPVCRLSIGVQQHGRYDGKP